MTLRTTRAARTICSTIAFCPSTTTMSAPEAVMDYLTSSAPFKPVHTKKPPTGQPGFCPGFTNLYPVKKLYSPPPHV